LPPEPFTAIILAAQRAGVVDPLAAEAGVSHKCVVPIAGKALIAHVVDALQQTPGLQRLRIVVEPDVVPAIRALLPQGAIAPEFVPSTDNLADSVHAGAHGVTGPFLVTTADNVLLTPGAVQAMMDAIRQGAGTAFAMANKASVMAAHPEGQRRFYRFADDEYSNCNLYAFSGPPALAAAESFRGGGQFAKKKSRLIRAIGLLNVILMLLGRLTLAGAARRLSRRFKVTIVAVVLPDGSHAIDVDNARTHRVAEALLHRRAMTKAPIPA
jgi:GTP:adenosylcobinamide-phosphate guanylyltransferase